MSAGGDGAIAVVGVGLIGGSVALAARERLHRPVRAYDPGDGVLEQALEHDAIDVACASIEEALAGADTAFVAAPVGALAATVEEVLETADEHCVVTDVGSTKRLVVSAVDDQRFVGGHPLAGAETAGVANARGDLFAGATWYLTPTARTSGVLYERLHRTIAALGALPRAIDSAAHDRLLASVSHVPHVVANVLVAHAAATLAAEREAFPAAGPSFRDATRVAGANSAIWTDIYLANRDAICEQIDALRERLGGVRDALAAQDAGAVEAWNDAAAADRRHLLETRLAGGPLSELRVSVPNRPGVVAQLALELGRSGVNIADMALYPAHDEREGVIAFWVVGTDAADRAEGLIAEAGYPVARP